MRYTAGKWVLLPLFASLLTVMVIKPVLTDSHNQDRYLAGMVMAGKEPLSLNASNLVDVLISLRLNLAIDRADYKGHVLALDLSAGTGKPEVSLLYEDLAKLISLCADKSGNVEQVRLRLMAEDSWTGERHLLLAASVRPEKVVPDLDHTLTLLHAAGNHPLGQTLKERLGIIETPLWKKAYMAGTP